MEFYGQYTLLSIYCHRILVVALCFPPWQSLVDSNSETFFWYKRSMAVPKFFATEVLVSNKR